MDGTKRIKELKAKINISKDERHGRKARLIIGEMKDGGQKVAVFVRSADQSYRGKCATMSEARERGLLSWMMESSLVPHLEHDLAVKAVIVIERESGDIWVSRIEDWSDDEKLLGADDGGIKTDFRGFSLRHLPVQHMQHLPAKTHLMTGRQRSIKK